MFGEPQKAWYLKDFEDFNPLGKAVIILFFILLGVWLLTRDHTAATLASYAFHLLLVTGAAVFLVAYKLRSRILASPRVVAVFAISVVVWLGAMVWLAYLIDSYTAIMSVVLMVPITGLASQALERHLRSKYH